MNLSNFVFMIEVGLVFGVVLAFGFYQLWSLNKLDREDAEQEERAKKDSGPESGN